MPSARFDQRGDNSWYIFRPRDDTLGGFTSRSSGHAKFKARRPRRPRILRRRCCSRTCPSTIRLRPRAMTPGYIIVPGSFDAKVFAW